MLVCFLALGEGLHGAAHLPVPGSVLGMALLLGWLALFPARRAGLEATTDWLTRHLSVMLVPAAVGIMTQGSVLARYGLALALATAVSTWATMVVAALVFGWAQRRFAPDGDAA